jgi:hypothetical protein
MNDNFATGVTVQLLGVGVPAAFSVRNDLLYFA